MNTNEIKKQAFDIQKDAFACWYDAMSILQDQAAQAVDTMLNLTNWVPDENHQAISSWIGTCKNERSRYKVYMEESFSVIEKNLMQDTMDSPAKPNKSAAEEKPTAPVEESKVVAVEE